MTTTIATWFVADTPDTETYFPQVGRRSSAPEFQAVYWRCIACFYFTSAVQNPAAGHIFFTNTDVPVVDGFDIQGMFDSLNVEVVKLAITYRLPRQSTSSWGNQFYILDIIKYLAREREMPGSFLVLDSDCVWNGTVEAIDRILTRDEYALYTLSEAEYTEGQPINGVTRREMAGALSSWREKTGSNGMPAAIHYHGGEIFGATLEMCKELAKEIDELWTWQGHTDLVGFKEEAHFLSILYADKGFKAFNANAVIKRMWTTFKHNNIVAGDEDRDIWHLPSEKKSGFARLYRKIADGSLSRQPDGLKRELRRSMGVPRRGVRKLVHDLLVKLAEHSGAAGVFTRPPQS